MRIPFLVGTATAALVLALSDPSRGVRIRAVRMLAAVPTEKSVCGRPRKFRAGSRGVHRGAALNADRPESRTTPGNFLVNRGRTAEAETPVRQTPDDFF